MPRRRHRFVVVEGVVLWGLQHRRWEPLDVIGIDEVSRRKGHQYLTIVYDLPMS